MKADAAPPPDSPPHSAPHSPAGGPPELAQGLSSLGQTIGTRNLLIAIVTMPLVFLLVVMGVIAVFGKPGGTRRAAEEARIAAVERLAEPAPAEPAPLAGAARPLLAAARDPAPLVLPPGADIAAMAVDGERLVVRVKGPAGGAILVYDLAAGALVQRISVVESKAGSPGDL